MKNIRIDSLATQLSETQQWELYEKAKQPNVLWTQTVQWAVAAFGLAKPPSRSVFYRWKTAMRKAEFKYRLREAALAKAQAVALGKNAATVEELVAVCQSFATVAILMENNVERAKEFVRLARMAQSISTQREKTVVTQRNAELLDVKIEIERNRKRILDCQLEREIEKNKKNDPAQRKKMTPEERDRKIREIFNLPTGDPPSASAQGDGPVLHRSAQEIVAAARRSRRRRRRSDAPPPEP